MSKRRRDRGFVSCPHCIDNAAMMAAEPALAPRAPRLAARAQRAALRHA
jgi:hypothetical protein